MGRRAMPGFKVTGIRVEDKPDEATLRVEGAWPPPRKARLGDEVTLNPARPIGPFAAFHRLRDGSDVSPISGDGPRRDREMELKTSPGRRDGRSPPACSLVDGCGHRLHRGARPGGCAGNLRLQTQHAGAQAGACGPRRIRGSPESLHRSGRSAMRRPWFRSPLAFCRRAGAGRHRPVTEGGDRDRRRRKVVETHSFGSASTRWATRRLVALSHLRRRESEGRYSTGGCGEARRHDGQGRKEGPRYLGITGEGVLTDRRSSRRSLFPTRRRAPCCPQKQGRDPSLFPRRLAHHPQPRAHGRASIRITGGGAMFRYRLDGSTPNLVVTPPRRPLGERKEPGQAADARTRTRAELSAPPLRYGWGLPPGRMSAIGTRPVSDLPRGSPTVRQGGLVAQSGERPSHHPAGSREAVRARCVMSRWRWGIGGLQAPRARKTSAARPGATAGQGHAPHRHAERGGESRHSPCSSLRDRREGGYEFLRRPVQPHDRRGAREARLASSMAFLSRAATSSSIPPQEKGGLSWFGSPTQGQNARGEGAASRVVRARRG